MFLVLLQSVGYPVEQGFLVHRLEFPVFHDMK